MAVRIPHLYVSAVGKRQQTGSLRVGRLYADVLIKTSSTGNTLSDTVNSSLTLNHTVDFTLLLGRSLTSNLTVSQNVSDVLILGAKNASNNLSVNHSVSREVVYARDISDSLGIEGEVERVITGNTTSNLSLSQDIIHFNSIGERNPAEQTLGLSQTVFLGGQPNANNTLGIDHDVSVVAPIKMPAGNPLGLTDSASTPINYRVEVSHSFSLVHVGTVPKVYDVTHNLALTQAVSVLGVVSTLNLTQNATIAKAYSANNEIDITQNAALEGVWFRTVIQDSSIGHSLTWYEDTDCSKKKYTPFQGESTTSNLSKLEEEIQSPQGSPNDTFSLYTPYIGTLEEKIDLRAPELDNRDRNAYTRINRETRGGKLIVYSDPDWPNTRTMAVTIIGLTESQVDAFQSFTQNTLGQYIGITDWEGQLWKGFITNPNEPAVQDGKARWTITFEFEGERLDIEKPGVDDGDGRELSMSQTVSVVKI